MFRGTLSLSLLQAFQGEKGDSTFSPGSLWKSNGEENVDQTWWHPVSKFYSPISGWLCIFLAFSAFKGQCASLLGDPKRLQEAARSRKPPPGHLEQGGGKWGGDFFLKQAGSSKPFLANARGKSCTGCRRLPSLFSNPTQNGPALVTHRSLPRAKRNKEAGRGTAWYTEEANSGMGKKVFEKPSFT